LRARNLKPGYFKNDRLAECSFEARYLFPGLWCLADREGRLEDRPMKIKGEVFPFDAVDVEALLAELVQAEMIIRYIVDGVRCIQVVNFSKHQSPHQKEVKSILPPPPRKGTDESRKGTTQDAPGNVSAALIPSSLIPSSLNPDSRHPLPDVQEGSERDKPKQNPESSPGQPAGKILIEVKSSDDWPFNPGMHPIEFAAGCRVAEFYDQAVATPHKSDDHSRAAITKVIVEKVATGHRLADVEQNLKHAASAYAEEAKGSQPRWRFGSRKFYGENRYRDYVNRRLAPTPAEVEADLAARQASQSEMFAAQERERISPAAARAKLEALNGR
jgi:hypothetical protein